MLQNKYYRSLFLLLFFVTLEAWSIAHGMQVLPVKVISLIHFISGLSIGIIALFQYQQPKISAPKWVPWLMYAAFSVLCAAMITNCARIFRQIPVDVSLADMLPIMTIMSQRFLDGKEVYDIIPEIWGGMQPIYLPAMWMPYIPSVIWKFDPRWITVFFMLAGTGLVLLFPPRDKKLSIFTPLIALPIYFLYQGFLLYKRDIIYLGDEGVVIGFYLLLIWAIWKRNPWLIGTAIVLSVLSRFGILFWSAMFGAFMLLYDTKERSIKTASTAAVLGLTLMFITKAIFHLDVFLALPGRYLKAVMETEVEKLKPTLDESLGLVKYFRHAEIPAFHGAAQISAVLVPIILLGLYARYKSRFDMRFFGIASLKICLVIFLNMLIVPVHMLFYTSAFLSIGMFAFFVQSTFTTSDQAVTNP